MLSAPPLAAHIGAHVTVMIPPTLVLLILYNAAMLAASGGADSMDKADRSDHSVGGALDPVRFVPVYFACLMKILLCTSYGSAGASKILEGIKKKGNPMQWMSGSSLQGSIFEAWWLSGRRGRFNSDLSFGLPTPFSGKLQRWILYQPKILSLKSVAAVAIEVVAPVI